MTATGERPPMPSDTPRLPWPSGHPAEAAHAALLRALADHLQAGLRVPCLDVPAGGQDNPWVTDANGPAAARAAAEACADCPALGQCRAYAVEAPETGGVWGGLTPRERAALMPRRKPGRPVRRDRRAAA